MQADGWMPGKGEEGVQGRGQRAGRSYGDSQGNFGGDRGVHCPDGLTGGGGGGERERRENTSNSTPPVFAVYRIQTVPP